MLDQLYFDGVCETDERSPFAIVCSHSIDGNVMDVYGETGEDAQKTAEEIIMRVQRTFVRDDIQAERERQDAQWGGPEHDDHHTVEDWCSILFDRVERAQSEIEGYYAEVSHQTYRHRLVQVAAVAVAAIEAYDRQEVYEQSLKQDNRAEEK